MITSKRARQAREALDRRLNPLRPASQYAVPQRGWIRAVRDALGMTASELGVRLGVADSSVRSLEEKEMSGGIRLTSLRRAAEALDCTLVYAFIPNESLEGTVRRQAQSVLDRRMARVRQTMVLEDQLGDTSLYSAESQLQALIDSGRLWSQESEQQ